MSFGDDDLWALENAREAGTIHAPASHGRRLPANPFPRKHRPEDLPRARELWDAGAKVADIGAFLGLGRAQMHVIARREGWPYRRPETARKSIHWHAARKQA